MIVIVCDNGGYAVINRLQTNTGGAGFNNLLKDCRVKDPANVRHVDFAKHAEAMGAYARHCDSLADLEAAMEWAQTTDATTVISIACDAYTWTDGGADWYVGVPEVSPRESVQAARKGQEEFRKKQRIGV
jgi:3D-(3,5/4)-trihydroxycyclohexane-1,2-dione acylhydrolase (decyclizing)